MNSWIAILTTFLAFAAIPTLNAFASDHTGIEIATDFSGTTWADKINAAIASLPPRGGAVDARTMCPRDTLSSADADIVLGNDKKPVNLELGTCTYPLGQHSIFYFSSSEIRGAGANTHITFAGSRAGLRYGGSLQKTGVYNVYLHDFALTGDGTTGSIGIDMTYALQSTLERLNIGGVDDGWKFGGTPTCACYNEIIRVSAFAVTRGGWLDRTANQNQIFGGAVRANKTTGIGLDIDGAASNQIYSLDIESSSTYSIEFHSNVYAPNGNVIVNPYIEAAGPILFEQGANENAIVGAGGLFERGSIVDRSGNTTNYFHQIGGGGGTHGIWPYYQAVQDGVVFGTDPFENSLAELSTPGAYGASELRWTTRGSSNQNGVFGHAPLEVGEAIARSGADFTGLTTISQLPTPKAPAVKTKGTLGNTEYRYYIVCHDRNGGVTLPSSAGLISDGNATLSNSSYNQITWTPIDGCWSWDILKGSTTRALVINQRVQLLSGDALCTFRDTGQSSRPYRPPTRNTTGDVTVAGMSVSKGLNWPLPSSVINGASFYCPNCDPPVNPPGSCTSRGTRSGSWVHGLNNKWICVP